MMRFGLNEKTIAQINAVFDRHASILRVLLFGSRAKGNYRPGSDIDLAIYGSAVSPRELDDINMELDDLLLPYSFDLIVFEAIDHAKLREHIERAGVVFYQRVQAEPYHGGAMKAGWEAVRLAEVCTFKPPKSEARKRLAETNMVSFAPMEDLGIDQKFLEPSGSRPLGSVVGSYTYFADGDVLLAKITPCFENGKLGIARNLENGIGFGSSEYFVIRPSNRVTAEYLYYFLSQPSFREAGAQSMTGAVGHKRVAKEFLEGHALPLPPLPEQQHIVAILDEAFAGIATARAAAEQNRQNARALFESHLQSVFSQRGEGWVEKTLDEAVDSLCSLSYGIVQPGEDQPGGLPIVRPTDLEGKTIELAGLKRIDPSLADSYRRTTLRGGDLLLCVRGSTGMISIASDALAGGNVTRGIVPIHFDDTLVTQNFGYYLMRSEPVQQQIREKTYGAALMQINIRDLRNLILPIPPRGVQAELADRFESMLEETQRLEALYQRKLEALDELKQSLLHQAFSGNL